MRKLLPFTALLLVLCLPVAAQQGNTLTINFPGVPSGGCVFFQVAQNSATGDLYWCKTGVWTQVAPGGVTGPTALKPATSDALQFVTAGGSDSNDGSSWGTAKATLQAAINALCALSTPGGIIEMAAGTVLVSATQVNCSNLTFRGRGWSTIVKLQNNATGITVTGVGKAYGPFVPANNAPAISNIRFEDFQIDGNKANQTIDNSSGEGTQAAIWLNLASNVTISNMYIHDATSDCIYNNGGATAITNQLIINNTILNCGLAGTGQVGRGISLGQAPQTVRILGNYIAGALSQGILVANEDSAGLSASDISIQGNTISGNNTSGGSVGGIQVTDNVVSTTPLSNVVTKKVKISGNIVEGNTGIGIGLEENATANTHGAVAEMDDAQISNNMIEGNTATPITVQATNGSIVNRPVIIANKIAGGGIIINGASVSFGFINANYITGGTSATIISDTGTKTDIGCNMVDESGNANMECAGWNSTASATGFLVGNLTLTNNLNANGKSASGLASATFSGSTSGTTKLQPQAVATGTLSLPSPAVSDTLVMSSQLPLSGSVAGSTTSLAANSCGDTVTSTVTGATTSMTATVSPSADPGTGLGWFAWVSAANTVSVKYCNNTTAAIVPAAATFQIRVIQ